MANKAPNNLPQTKSEYLKAMIVGRQYLVLDLAILFYHCEVPLDEAKRYLTMYESKLQHGRL